MMVRSAFAAVGFLCLVALPAAAQQAAADNLPFKLTQVGPGVYAAIGGPKAGSNAGFVIGDDGVLVVDSFFYPDAAKALRDEIRRITDKPIRYVINTHYHIDHVSGDAVFKAAGATIIAHRNVPGWIHTGNRHLMGGDAIPPDIKAQIDALIPPDRTIDKAMVLMLGKRRVAIRPVLGHTGGDLEVEVPDAKVMFTGDILWNHSTPNLTDATTSQWIVTLSDLERLPNEVFVPGHGDVATSRDVASLRQLFTDLREWTTDARRQGLSGNTLQQSVAGKLRAQHGDWLYMDRGAPVLADFMDQELAGTKRVPVPAAK